MSKIIRGSKGPPEPRQPVRAEDTLNSKEFATVQDLLSEGEIEGWATPSKKGIARNNANYNNACLADIFLNNTPIISVDTTLSNSAFATKISNLEDGDFNFQDVTFTPRFGTASQSHVPGFKKTATSILSQSVAVSKGSPFTSQNITTGKDAVEVTITFNTLQKFETNGDILGTSVKYLIKRQINGGNFETRVEETITGRTVDPYSREFRIDLTSGYTQAAIRVERETDNSTDLTVVSDTFQVTRVEEIVDEQRDYPNSAYSTLRLSSEQFSSVPQRSFRIRGIKVRIPGAGANSTGTPTVDSVTGRIIYPPNYIFNGTMGAAVWCSCPAMILLDVLTTQRYGLGDHISDSDLDLFSFVQASKYANTLITDNNVTEPRFSCNVNIQGSTEAFTLINELAGIMRAFPIWESGSITISQDAPTDPSFLFSLSNVTEAGFSYSGSSLKQRHSIVAVSYFNMDSKEIDYEVYGDDPNDPIQVARVNKLGVVKKTVKAFGCTSRTQARRLAKAIVFSEEQESEVVSFTTSIDAGALIRPGNVISINDPVRASFRRSGRLKSINNAKTQITVDNNQDLSNVTGTDQTLSLLLPSGSVEPQNISSISGSVITVSSPFTETPNENTLWLISSSTLEPQTFRVITVEEQDGINYAITALTYVPGKYANIETNDALPERNISLLNEPKNPPSGLTAQERTIVINNVATTKIILSWQVVTGVSQYLVQFRYNGANWTSVNVFRPDFEIFDSAAGDYEFRVYSYNAALKLSTTPSTLSFVAVGKTARPGPVQNLSLEPLTNKLVRLRWDLATDADVIHGGRVYVRHSNKTDGTGTFQNSVDLVPALAGNSTMADVPSLEGEYILKFQDDGARFSVDETSIILDEPDLIDSQQVIGDREDTDNPEFGGTLNNLSVVADALQLTNPATNLVGTYDFATIMDLEGVFSVNLKRLIQSIGFAEGGQTITAAYTQSGTTITITSNAHGRSQGDYVNFVAVAGGGASGVYQIKNGSVTTNTFQITSTASATISSSACTFAFVNTIDQLIPAGTFWNDYATDGNFDGPQVDDVSALMTVRTTSTPPSNGSSYQLSDFSAKPFNTFANGTFKGRGFQFRLKLESESLAHNISVQQLGIFASFESRTERSYVTGNTTSIAPLTSSTSASGLNVTFGKPFFVGTSTTQGGANAFPPSVGITIIGASGGDYFILSNITGTGFNIKILDSSNNPVNPPKQFTFQAVGYGKGV
tara:strand:- start:1362 stop:5045 length:3684 start_codon:yes stop_codon:yes gene_type:complete